MQNVNFKQLPVSVTRLTIAILYYYCIFKGYIPQFLYDLQTKMGYFTNGLIRVEFQVLGYILGIIPITILLYPLLKKELKINYKKLLLTFMFVIVFALLLNVISFSFVSFINDGNFVISDNQNGLNILMFQNIYLHHFMIILLAPFLEELVFRGAIFRGIRSKYGFLCSSIISSILFGLIHVSTVFTSGNFIDIIYLFLYTGIGFLFCGTYEYNKSIWACVILHVLYNAYTILI